MHDTYPTHCSRAAKGPLLVLNFSPYPALCPRKTGAFLCQK